MLAPTRSCPRRAVTERSTFLLELYQHYKSGHLLQAGGIADQPALYFESMTIIQGEVNRNREH